MPLISARILPIASLAAIVGFTSYVPPVQAFNFGDMMNPGRWMGGKNRDRYDDYYDDYGPYGGPWGGGPWGGGPYGGGPYGGPYGAPYGGYGTPGYGYGAPGYMGAPAAAPPAAAAPAQSGSSGKSEIDALKRRIEELESSQRTQPPAPTSDWPSAPAFRPMNQY